MVPLRRTTIIVGQNNAGKSTIVEALRLVSVVTSRYEALSYRPVPSWLDIPLRYRGVCPSLDGLEINLKSIFHGYGNPPAIITASFDDGSQVTIYIGPKGAIHAVLLAANGDPITSKSQALGIRIPPVSILPQVGPLAREEKLLQPDYVRRAMSSVLAPLHFRNQLCVLREAFSRFKRLAQASWPGLEVREMGGCAGEQDELSLLIRDGDFAAEVGWMGHGLQMWLQVIWFLTRVEDGHSIILDEPDVYMHADLQRRLIRLIKARYHQVIVATHSVEILSEVGPEDVLVIDRRKKESFFANSAPSVQRVIDRLGGVHNLHLTRLWSSKRYLLVEGKDIALLKQFQNILFPDSAIPVDTIPSNSIGGWGGWHYAVGSTMTLKNSLGQTITTYCILDRDYHTPQEIDERKADAVLRSVELHIWSRKEIENYLLVPSAIQRVILADCRRGDNLPTEEQIRTKLDELTETLKDEVFDALTTEYLARDRAGGVTKAHRHARERISAAWSTDEGRLAIVSGKTLISNLSRWCQQQFDVSLSTARIARELRQVEICPELRSVIAAIERAEPISQPVDIAADLVGRE
jgi:energy-coupling factor transporter ATP-binding protein EcfA2